MAIMLRAMQANGHLQDDSETQGKVQNTICLKLIKFIILKPSYSKLSWGVLWIVDLNAWRLKGQGFKCILWLDFGFFKHVYFLNLNFKIGHTLVYVHLLGGLLAFGDFVDIFPDGNTFSDSVELWLGSKEVIFRLLSIL